MTECIHGLVDNQCGACADIAPKRASVNGTMAGKSFALVFAPSIRDDTFLHLNREGDHWKFRWYSSPSRPATELAQSGRATTRLQLELSGVEFVHEIAYPYSTSPGGVSILNSRFWFDEIAKTNVRFNIAG